MLTPSLFRSLTTAIIEILRYLFLTKDSGASVAWLPRTNNPFHFCAGCFNKLTHYNPTGVLRQLKATPHFLMSNMGQIEVFGILSFSKRKISSELNQTIPKAVR